MFTKPIPDGYTTITPYLVIRGASDAIQFYRKAFNALEIKRMINPGDGKIMHAEIKIGNAFLMVADEFLDMGFKSPQALGGSTAFIHLYVENADDLFHQAQKAGAKIIKALGNEFFGDRHGIVQDPFGYMWAIATHIEDISPKELEHRLAEYSKNM